MIHVQFIYWYAMSYGVLTAFPPSSPAQYFNLFGCAPLANRTYHCVISIILNNDIV